MKFGIALKLGLLLALSAALATGTTGYYAYQSSRALLVNAAKGELMTATLALARRLTLTRIEADRDLAVLTQHHATQALFTDTATPTDIQALQELATLMLQAQPSYFQVRLIDARDHGMERVRVDRGANGPVLVGPDDLQEKGHFDYVSQTLRLPANQSYVSRVAINHERGAHQGEDQPSMQLARPVIDAQGQALGVAVLNIDLKGTFDLLVKDLPASFRLYFANDEGDILIHPDPAKTFGFDKGRRIFIQDEFPLVRPLVEGQLAETVFETHSGEHAAQPAVAAFIAPKTQIAAANTHLVLGLSQPLDEVLADTRQLGSAILQIVVGLSVASLLVALLMARALTRPINAISQAARNLANGLPPGHLPLKRQDEIGDMARAFRDMRQQIDEQMSELRDNQDELEHLAQHDPLTGLPNRRKFQERLGMALALARRSHHAVNVLFVDLDRFKHINDHHGHEAGDAVLQSVAQRLQAALREADTVARIGGDEFVVLLGAPATTEQLDVIARKLLQVLREPVHFDGKPLELGCSIGIASYPEHAHNAAELLAAADHAMYQAKTAGRNTYRFFDPSVPPPSPSAV